MAVLDAVADAYGIGDLVGGQGDGEGSLLDLPLPAALKQRVLNAYGESDTVGRPAVGLRLADKAAILVGAVGDHFGAQFNAYLEANPIVKTGLEVIGLAITLANPGRALVGLALGAAKEGLIEHAVGRAVQQFQSVGYSEETASLGAAGAIGLAQFLLGAVTLTAAVGAVAGIAGVARSKAKQAGAAKGAGTAADFGIPNFINPRQNLHIPPVTDGRSVLTANPSDLLQGLHDGAFTILRQPKPGQVVVDFGKPIGEFWSNGARVGETQFGSVAFGKKGAHIIPANPNQW